MRPASHARNPIPQLRPPQLPALPQALADFALPLPHCRAGLLLAKCTALPAGYTTPDRSGPSAGALVQCHTKWVEADIYDAIVGPEKHLCRIEPGPGGKYAAPMQVLLAAAASCTATNMMGKLKQAGAKVDSFEVKTEGSREKFGDLASTIFATIDMEIIVKASNLTEEKLDELVHACTCSVVTSLGGPGRTVVTKTATLLK